MEQRRATLRRLAAVGVPHSQLVEVISRLQDDPIDEDQSVGRWALRRSFDELLSEVGCTIQLPTDGGEFRWFCLSLPKTLQLLARESQPFQNMLAHLFRSTPCSVDAPYNLALYADEV